MKTAVLLLALFLFLAVGALSLSLFSGSRDAGHEQRPVTAAASEAASSANAAADARTTELLQRMDGFARQIDDLHAEIAALRAGAAREPAAEVAVAAPVDEPSASFASEHRSAILKVIEEDRQEQKRKQADDQRARDLQAALTRAERTAKQFGLAGDQQKALADVYILERQKMEDIRNLFQNQGGPGGDPEAMRTSFRELRDWRLNELTTRLGTDLADKINDADIAAFRGGFGGGGGGGGGGRRGNRGQGDQGGAGGNGNGGQDSGNRPGGGF